MGEGITRRRLVRIALVGAGVLALVWVVVAAYLLIDGSFALSDGSEGLRDVRQGASVSDLVDDDTAHDVEQAGDRLEHAAARFDNPLLGPIRLVPVASRHLAAVRKVAHGSSAGAAIAERSLHELQGLMDRPHRSGAERLAVLRGLGSVARRTAADLDAIDVGSSEALASPMGTAVEELRSQRDDARVGARRMAMVAGALEDVLRGPEPYLLLGANNAEMRNDSGMFLSAATLSLRDGELELGPVSATADVVLPARTVPVDGDLARNWSWLDAGRDLRNLGLTADFPQSARLAVANWAKAPGGARVAGVIVVDVDAIRALLRVVGPVTVDGVRYTADDVRGQLLREQYRRTPDQQARRDQLGEVAHRIFEELQAGHWEVDDLATGLVDAVAGRHLLVWSTDPSVQRVWRTVAADGHLSPNSVSVALLNRSAHKLDSWVDTAATIRTVPREAGAEVTITYRIRNRAPADGPAYLVGPNVEGLSAGDHRGLVVVNLPRGTTRIRLTGASGFLAGHDGPTEVVGGEVTVRRGQTATVTVRAILPKGLDHLVLEPSARIEHTRWTVDGHSYERDRRRSVTLRSEN